jgi:hypothetical protein
VEEQEDRMRAQGVAVVNLHLLKEQVDWKILDLAVEEILPVLHMQVLVVPVSS